MNCLQHRHTFSFLKIFKVASDEADPPFHSSLFTPTRRLHFERKHSFPASAKLPPKPSQPLLNLVWRNKYQGNIFRLILLLQTVLLLRAMSLHRQPHEEQEEIFTNILSSFSSLAATSPSFSSCFPEHSEINSALLLLKVRRGTWLKKDVLSRWPTYILASDGFLSRSTVNELWKCFHSAITSPPCQTVSLGRLRGISVQNHRLLWTLFFCIL